MIYSINMHTTIYQFWRFVYHHEQSVIDHYARSSFYTRSFCMANKLYVGHFYGPATCEKKRKKVPRSGWFGIVTSLSRAYIGNYDRQTDQPTDQQTDMRGHREVTLGTRRWRMCSAGRSWQMLLLLPLLSTIIPSQNNLINYQILTLWPSVNPPSPFYAPPPHIYCFLYPHPPQHNLPTPLGTELCAYYANLIFGSLKMELIFLEFMNGCCLEIL